MKERKNLENLFQEKLIDFEVTPADEVWENIEFKLKEKKEKRRVIPFWWKLSGIAASLLIGGLIVNNFLDSGKSSNGTIINQQSVTKSDGGSQIKSNAGIATSKQENDPTNTDNAVASEGIKSNESSPKEGENVIHSSQVNGTNNIATIEKEAENVVSGIKSVANMHNKKRRSNAILNKTAVERTAVANKNNNSSERNLLKKINGLTNGKLISKENEVLAQTSSEKSETSEFNTNGQQNTKIENPTITNNVIVPKDNVVSNESTNPIKKIDSTKIASVEPNALEELLKEKEKKTIAEQKLNRWQVSTNIAPIYFSSTSNGSPIDAKFVNNSKQYNTNLSYGIGVNYALNKKIRIRTGINAVAYDYSTTDLVIYQENNASRLQHLDANVNGSVLQIENKSSQSEIPEISLNGNAVKKFDSSLNQKFGYIEVPLEMSYTILDKKFGVEVIGGLSTLFLNQNEVNIVSSGLNMNIGKANNLNDLHFSSNLGLGFKYGFLKHLEARIEPVFKYQINTFSNGAGNFRPYVLGVYSGISYKF